MDGMGSKFSIVHQVIRNSWGTGWGAAGYILFQRGVNLCGVEDWAAATTIVG